MEVAKPSNLTNISVRNIKGHVRRSVIALERLITIGAVEIAGARNHQCATSAAFMIRRVRNEGARLPCVPRQLFFSLSFGHSSISSPRHHV